MSDQQNNALTTFFNEIAPKKWTNPLVGTVALPDAYKSYELKQELYIEYLQKGDGSVPSKNHVVFQVHFVEPQKLQLEDEHVMLKAARISMDMGNESVGQIDEDRIESKYTNKVMLSDYYPGTMFVKLLKYNTKSVATNKIVQFANLDFATLGDFVDFLVARKLHEMSFWGYGVAWKGCRHFITQAFLQMREMKKVSAIDEDGQSFKENITKVHHRDTSNHRKLVDRGTFLNYIPIYPADIVDAYEIEEEIEV